MLQSYEKGFWHCHLMSPYVLRCHLNVTLVSPYRVECQLFRCKVTKKNFVTVRICPHMSVYVRFCPFFYCHKPNRVYADLFTLQSYENEIWHCPNLSEFVRICPNLSIFKVSSRGTLFSLQSYEKDIWHCPAMSSYVHLCPFICEDSTFPSKYLENVRCLTLIYLAHFLPLSVIILNLYSF